MPTLDATTSAAFAATGVDATSLWSVLQYGFSTILSIGLWAVKAAIPFLGVLAVFGLMLGLVYAAFRFFRRAH